MFHHQTLAAGGWQKLSLFEQLGNVGSEVGRAASSQGRDRGSYDMASRRVLELMDLTLEDIRWRARLKEIARARELLAAAILEDSLYQTSLNDLERYFSQFAIAARLGR